MYMHATCILLCKFSELVENNFLLFTDPYHRQIYQMDKSTSELTTVRTQGAPVPRMEFPVSLDFDLAGRRVYWVDADDNTISSSNLDGSDADRHVTLAQGAFCY